MDGGQAAVMSGIHRLKHIESFAAAALTDHDTVRAHTQTVANEIADGNFASALDVGRTRFKTDDMLLMELKLGGIFDGDDTLTVGQKVAQYVEERGFSTVRALCGHGIGREMHEDPQVPNYGIPGHGVRLRRGMTSCIEPMIAAGDYHVKTLRDGWTVVTTDGSLCSHYEHTILITDGEPELLSYPGYHKEEKR